MVFLLTGREIGAQRQKFYPIRRQGVRDGGKRKAEGGMPALAILRGMLRSFSAFGFPFSHSNCFDRYHRCIRRITKMFRCWPASSMP